MSSTSPVRWRASLAYVLPLLCVGSPDALRADEFVADIRATRAVQVRLGNDALATIAASIPEAAPADLLQGKLDDIRTSSSTSGRSFRVAFRGLSYSATLAEARVECLGKDQLLLALGIRNLRLVINRTSITGRSHSARAGRMTIVVGHRRPAWLTAVVTPEVVDGQVRLRPKSKKFALSRDNWYVAAPRSVSTSGPLRTILMPKKRVSEGLVSGLRKSRSRIVREVESVVPKLVGKLEEELDLAPGGDALGRAWPFPVYEPRAQLRAETIRTDADGLTLAMGLLVDVPRETPETSPFELVEVAAPSEERLVKSRDLVVAVSPAFLKPLTRRLARSDAANIPLVELPEPAFIEFQDRAFLEAVAPETKRFPAETSFWGVLSLAGPVSVEENDRSRIVSVDDSPSPSHAMDLVAKKLRIDVAVQEPGDEDGRPYMQFEFSLRQPVALGKAVDESSQSRLRMDWGGPARITARARFAEPYRAANRRTQDEPAQKLAEESWQALVEQGPLLDTAFPDVAGLRLADAFWADDRIAIRLASPGATLSNTSGRDMRYHLRGRDGVYRGPRILVAGADEVLKGPARILVNGRAHQIPNGAVAIFDGQNVRTKVQRP